MLHERESDILLFILNPGKLKMDQNIFDESDQFLKVEKLFL